MVALRVGEERKKITAVIKIGTWYIWPSIVKPSIFAVGKNFATIFFLLHWKEYLWSLSEKKERKKNVVFKCTTICAPVLGNLTSWVHSNRNAFQRFTLSAYTVATNSNNKWIKLSFILACPANEERIGNLEWHLIIAICELKMINTV